MIVENADTDSDIRESRVSSVAFKILGSIAALSTAVSLITGVALVAGSPLAAISLLASAVFGAIVAHDLVQVGCNQRDAIKVFSPPPNADISQTISHYASGLYQLGKAAIGEVTRETPFVLRGTWVFEPAYKLFQDTFISCEQEI